MNFVDAIRLASQNAVAFQAAAQQVPLEAEGTPSAVTPPPVPSTEPAQEPAQPVMSPTVPHRVLNNLDSTEDPVVTQLIREPNGGSIVRIELRLSAEQTQVLLNSALNSNHRYLTSREAAKYLRLSKLAVEEMAELKSLPGFRIDGTWRFEKNSLDDWAAQRIAKPQGNQESAA